MENNNLHKMVYHYLQESSGNNTCEFAKRNVSNLTVLFISHLSLTHNPILHKV